MPNANSKIRTVLTRKLCYRKDYRGMRLILTAQFTVTDYSVRDCVCHTELKGYLLTYLLTYNTHMVCF